QDGGFPDLMVKYLYTLGGTALNHFPFLIDALRHLVSRTPAKHVMPWFAQGIDAGDGVLRLKRPWYYFGRRRLNLSWERDRLPWFQANINKQRELSRLTGGTAEVPLAWTLGGYLITPHPLGGCNMGADPTRGVTDQRGEVFGYRNLYVADA